MATAHITRSCGHQTSEYLCYKGAARKTEIAALAAKPCRSCATSQQLRANPLPPAPVYGPVTTVATLSDGGVTVTVREQDARFMFICETCGAGHGGYATQTAAHTDAARHPAYCLRNANPADAPRNLPRFSETAAYRAAIGLDRD